ncbi:MAG: DUF6141 family protein [Acidobacteria bacterium]|nr:DUF6141 family protein [Acidobacteriota bacterium]
MIHYREVQRFRQLWLWALLAPVPVLFGWGLIQQIVLGKPWGSKPMPDLALMAVAAITLLFPIWFWNMRLVIEVRDQTLEFIFLLLWRRRRIPLDRIERAEPVTYRPIREYGGWGIRLGRDGWCYNVRGDRGVRLELEGGEKLLLGSQAPEELARAILERKNLLGGRRARV